MAKPNIKKLIQDQTNKSIPRLRTTPMPEQTGMFADNPMFAAAELFTKKMNWKYKLAIGGAIYLLLAGVVGTVIGIAKLINLI